MNLFLDEANTDYWADLAGTGLFSGITTNPLLIQRAGLATSIEACRTLYDHAMKLGYPCIQFQVFDKDWLQCAQSIASIGPEVFIKVPANRMDFEVVSRLRLPDRTTRQQSIQLVKSSRLRLFKLRTRHPTTRDSETRSKTPMSYLIGCRMSRLKLNS